MKVMKYRTLVLKLRGKLRTIDRRLLRYTSRLKSMRGSYWSMRENQEIKRTRLLG